MLDIHYNDIGMNIPRLLRNKTSQIYGYKFKDHFVF